jgi:hypothetical protein
MIIIGDVLIKKKIAVNKFYCFSAVLEWSFSNNEKYIEAIIMDQLGTSRTTKKFKSYISNKFQFSTMFSPKPHGKWQ